MEQQQTQTDGLYVERRRYLDEEAEGELTSLFQMTSKLEYELDLAISLREK